MSRKLKNFCRFDRDMDEKLIKLVSENEVLYDSGNKLHKDMMARDEVWTAIAADMGKCVEDCKTRWRSIRDLYHRKKKEQRRGSKKQRSPWEYMDMLAFLDDFIIERKLLVAHVAEDPREEMPNQNGSNNHINFVDSPLSMNESSTSSSKRTLEDEESNILGTKKMKTEHPQDETNEENESIQLLRKIRDAAHTKQHPIKMFFDSMAKTVMSFPPILAAQARLKVCQIVTELECRMLNAPDYINNKMDENVPL